MTREKFREALVEAMSEFNEKGAANGGDPLTLMTMGMQNMVFGAMLEAKLFDKETKDNIEEDK